MATWTIVYKNGDTCMLAGDGNYGEALSLAKSWLARMQEGFPERIITVLVGFGPAVLAPAGGLRQCVLKLVSGQTTPEIF